MCTVAPANNDNDGVYRDKVSLEFIQWLGNCFQSHKPTKCSVFTYINILKYNHNVGGDNTMPQTFSWRWFGSESLLIVQRTF